MISVKLFDGNIIIAKKILKLRNKKKIISWTISKKTVLYKEHINWIKKFKKRNLLYIIYFKKNFAGYLRIEKDQTTKVSWAVEEKFQRKFIFYKILKKYVKTKYLAYIIKENISSLITALKAGFKIHKVKKKYLILKI